MSTTPEDELATERISIRCTPAFKAAVLAAAKKDRRKKYSQWIVSALEEIMGFDPDSQQSHLKVAEEPGNESSHSTPANFAPTKYPTGRIRKKNGTN